MRLFTRRPVAVRACLLAVLALACGCSDDPPEDGPRRPLGRVPIGLEATITPEKTGTLYLQINDSPGELLDNRGSLSVTIQAVP